jgi:hypothetical protein
VAREDLTVHAEWYYKRDHKVHGPFTAAEMLRLAADASVLPQDFVSNAPGGPWTRLAFCEEELAGLVPSAAPCDSPAAVPPRPGEVETGIERHGARSEAESTVAAPPSHSDQLRERNVSRRRTAGWTRGSLTRRSLEWLSQYRVVVAGLAVIVLINIAVLAFSPRDLTNERYQTVVEVWSRTQQLAQSSASADEWRLLSSEAHARLDPLIAEWEKNADVRRQVDQHLLWMCRDYLMPTIQSCVVISQQQAPAQKPSELSASFRTRIEKCEYHLRKHFDAIERIVSQERRRR